MTYAIAQTGLRYTLSPIRFLLQRNPPLTSSRLDYFQFSLRSGTDVIYVPNTVAIKTWRFPIQAFSYSFQCFCFSSSDKFHNHNKRTDHQPNERWQRKLFTIVAADDETGALRQDVSSYVKLCVSKSSLVTLFIGTFAYG